MKRTFIGSLMTLGTMFIITAVLFGIGVGAGEASVLYNIALGGVVMMMCLSPLVILTTIISGIGTLINRLRGVEKQKRGYDNFAFDEDMELDDIMAQLSPQQQDYLQERLRNNRLGIGNDGELMSMNDLLNSYEEKEKRM